jgi:ADP-ribose pyrophosphatase
MEQGVLSGKSQEKTEKQLNNWELLSREEVFVGFPWIRVHKDTIRLPSGRVVNDFYWIELPEYTIIYAQDKDGKILFVRQYQHALGRVSIVLPTGSLEEGEQPLKAAQQELLEETGYTAGIWRSVGSFVVDGNKGCTKFAFFHC